MFVSAFFTLVEIQQQQKTEIAWTGQTELPYMFNLAN